MESSQFYTEKRRHGPYADRCNRFKTIFIVVLRVCSTYAIANEIDIIVKQPISVWYVTYFVIVVWHIWRNLFTEVDLWSRCTVSSIPGSHQWFHSCRSLVSRIWLTHAVALSVVQVQTNGKVSSCLDSNPVFLLTGLVVIMLTPGATLQTICVYVNDDEQGNKESGDPRWDTTMYYKFVTGQHYRPQKVIFCGLPLDTYDPGSLGLTCQLACLC